MGRCGSCCLILLGLVAAFVGQLVLEFYSLPEALPLPTKIGALVAPRLFYVAGMRTDSPFKFRRLFGVKGALPTYPEGLNGTKSIDVTLNDDGLLARLYAPVDLKKNERVPLFLFFHGGGGTINHATHDPYDPATFYISNKARWIVVSVDYRLAPENKWPAGLEDAFTSLRWVARGAAAHPWLIHADLANIIIGGDSMGGNFAGVLSYDWVHRGPESIRLVHQMLFYPAVFYLNDTLDYLTDPKYDHAPLLPRTVRDFFFFVSYFPALSDEELLRVIKSTRVSLMQADLKGIPDTHIIVAEFDPLYDELHSYASALTANGTHVEMSYYADAHGFAMMNDEVEVAVMDNAIAKARAAMERARSN